MAEQPPVTSPSEPSAPQAAPQSIQEQQTALHAMAGQLRQATVHDMQTHREVHLTEDEVKAMADALDAMAERLTAAPAPKKS